MKIFLVEVERLEGNAVITEHHHVRGDDLATVAILAQQDLIDGFEHEDREIVAVRYLFTTVNDYRSEGA